MEGKIGKGRTGGASRLSSRKQLPRLPMFVVPGFLLMHLKFPPLLSNESPATDPPPSGPLLPEEPWRPKRVPIWRTQRNV